MTDDESKAGPPTEAVHIEDTHDEKVHQMEVVIAKLLAVGVILSATIVAIGGALLIAQHGANLVDVSTFHGEPLSLRSLSGIVLSAVALRPKSIIQLGLLILVATPIARVVFSMVLFLRKKDYLYVGITGVVLAILILAISDEH